MDVRTGLYRIFDAAGALIYVGIGSFPNQRLATHRGAPWGASIDRMEVEWFPTRQAALMAETAAIATESPLHNKALNQARLTKIRSTLPVTLDLVAAAEIAAILGVSRARVGQIVNSGNFPDPVAELVVACVWLESDVRAWVKRTGRKSVA